MPICHEPQGRGVITSDGVMCRPIKVEFKAYETPSPLLVVTFNQAITTSDANDVSPTGWSGVYIELPSPDAPAFYEMILGDGVIAGNTVTFPVSQGDASVDDHHHVEFTGFGNNLRDAFGNEVRGFAMTAPMPVSVEAVDELTIEVTFDGDLEALDVGPNPQLDLQAWMGHAHWSMLRAWTTGARTLRVTLDMEAVLDPQDPGYDNWLWYDAGFASLPCLYGANGIGLPPWSIELTDARAAIQSITYNETTGVFTAIWDKALTANSNLDMTDWTIKVPISGTPYLPTVWFPELTATSVGVSGVVSDASESSGESVASFTNYDVDGDVQLCDYLGFPVIPFADVAVTAPA